MAALRTCSNELCTQVLDTAFLVHRALGPGLLESVYQQAMALELSLSEIPYSQQTEVPIIYKGHNLGMGFRADFVIADSLILELKTVESLDKVHIAQLISYLKLLNIKTGYLLNFNTAQMKNGIKRLSI